MPEPDIKSKIPRAVSLDVLVLAKRRWGVSVSALAYRLHKLGILTDWLYRGMVIEMGRRGFTTNEPNGIPRESSVLLKHVLTDLWHDGISRGHIAKQLNIPPEELENLVFGLLGTPPYCDDETTARKKSAVHSGLRLV
jgi:Zn-dependent peptidase ImmA (M78 family)